MNVSKEQINAELESTLQQQPSSTFQDTDEHSGTCHQCTVCSKTFSTVHTLKRHHREVHERVRHPCIVCSKTFSQSGDLKKHIREQHEGKRIEFKCDECFSVFARQDYLKAHQETHSGTRFHCEFCDRSYSRHSVLKAHIREQHGEI